MEVQDTSSALLAKACQTVHFYLLALCFALAVLARLAPLPKIEKAKQDFDKIALACRNWRSSWQTAGEALYDKYPKQAAFPRSISADVVEGGFDTNSRWWFAPSRWRIPRVIADNLEDLPNELKAPKSLHDFHILWNQMNGQKATFQLALSIEPVLLVEGVGGDRYNVKWAAEPRAKADPLLSESQLLVLPIRTRKECPSDSRLRSTDLVFCSKGVFQSFRLEGDFGQFDIDDLQDVLITYFFGNSIVDGPFEQSFPRVARGYCELPKLELWKYKTDFG